MSERPDEIRMTITGETALTQAIESLTLLEVERMVFVKASDMRQSETASIEHLLHCLFELLIHAVTTKAGFVPPRKLVYCHLLHSA